MVASSLEYRQASSGRPGGAGVGHGESGGGGQGRVTRCCRAARTLWFGERQLTPPGRRVKGYRARRGRVHAPQFRLMTAWLAGLRGRDRPRSARGNLIS